MISPLSTPPQKEHFIETFLEEIDPVRKEKEDIEQHGRTYFQLLALFSDYQETKTGNESGQFSYN